jgi:hypothetical protein
VLVCDNINSLVMCQRKHSNNVFYSISTSHCGLISMVTSLYTNVWSLYVLINACIINELSEYCQYSVLQLSLILYVNRLANNHILIHMLMANKQITVLMLHFFPKHVYKVNSGLFHI